MNLRTLTICAAVSLLFACNSQKKQAPAEDSTATAKTGDVTPEAAPAAAKTFDINAIAVSDKPLGAFPYFNLPEGYENFSKNNITDFDVIYCWVKDHFERPEGKVFYNSIKAKDGKSYSDVELIRNLDEVITGVGGVKVSEGKIPNDSFSVIPSNNQLKYRDGYGFLSSAVTTTYLIRRADRNIWVQTTPGDDAVSAGWIIVETKPFKATASLIKADEMKKELDSKGHIALYINFDTDKASIKSESQPVIDEIHKLMADNAGLKVSIEGHTDNSGAPAHNKQLSEDRANSVKSALTGKGIDATRIQAKGLGADKPIADNNSEEGKTKNRRVEIVKI